MRYFRLRFDGACVMGDGGKVVSLGCGWHVDELVSHVWKRFARRSFVKADEALTINVAEWTALIDGLEWMSCIRCDEHSFNLHIEGDSMLVIEQLNENWKCKKLHLQDLKSYAQKLLSEMKIDGMVSWSAKWIPHHENTYADILSRSTRVLSVAKY